MKYQFALFSLVVVGLQSLLAPSTGHSADDNDKDFESLGANQAILKRARNLDSNNKIMVVQKRSVDRNLRLEFGGTYGANAGGDSYLNTQIVGGQLDFHINPRWSLGGRYYQSLNSLTDEGKRVYDNAQERANRGQKYEIPDLDYPISTWLAVVNWYPIYGKTNLLDLGIAQFDFYTLAGYGQIKLASGTTDTYTAGGGMGFWINNHVTSRLEVRYQTYEDQVYSGARRMNIVVANVSIGFLL